MEKNTFRVQDVTLVDVATKQWILALWNISGTGFQFQIADRIKIRIYYQTLNFTKFDSAFGREISFWQVSVVLSHFQ